VEQWIDDLALLKSGDGTVLPVDWADVRGYTLEGSVAAHECVVAELQSLIQKTPELVIVSLCKYSYLWKIKTDNSLVETAFPFIFSVLILPWGEE